MTLSVASRMRLKGGFGTAFEFRQAAVQYYDISGLEVQASKAADPELRDCHCIIERRTRVFLLSTMK